MTPQETMAMHRLNIMRDRARRKITAPPMDRTAMIHKASLDLQRESLTMQAEQMRASRKLVSHSEKHVEASESMAKTLKRFLRLAEKANGQ